MELLVGLVVIGQFAVIVWLLDKNSALTRGVIETAQDAITAIKSQNVEQYVAARAAQRDSDANRKVAEKVLEESAAAAQFSARNAPPTPQFSDVYKTPDGKELKVMRPL